LIRFAFVESLTQSGIKADQILLCDNRDCRKLFVSSRKRAAIGRLIIAQFPAAIWNPRGGKEKSRDIRNTRERGAIRGTEQKFWVSRK
jgi:hypothetical protein